MWMLVRYYRNIVPAVRFVLAKITIHIELLKKLYKRTVD